MGDLIQGLLLGVPLAYVLAVLLLQEKTDHEGPLASDTRKVSFPSGHEQRVALFDYVRRLFGAYLIHGNMWYVTPKAERFTCPVCLGFWAAFLLTVPFAAVYGVNGIYGFVLLHLSAVTSANVVYRYGFGEAS